MTAVAEEDIAGTFADALKQDAGRVPAAGEPVPAPPVKPDAPVRPAPKPRPSKTAKADAKPRTAPAEVTAAAPRDYTADLITTGEQAWFGASMIRGGWIGPVKIPDLRPYAAVFRDQVGPMASAWNAAAQQNATVRQYVSKLGGDGGVSWVMGVGIATAGLVAACVAVSSAPAEVRAELAASNDAALDAYVKAMIERAGLQPAEGTQAA